MKIYSASREDILRRQQENENWYNEQNAKYQEQYNAYHEKYVDAKQGLQNYVETELAPYIEPLRIAINITTSYSYRSERTFRVELDAGRAANSRNEVALFWRYNADIDDDGNVVAEASGYSTQLNVNTPEMLENLELSVQCLKKLRTIDWKKAISSYIPPRMSEEVTEENPNYRYNQTKEMLDRELEVAEIEDLIGTNTLVSVYGDGSNRNYYGNVWMQILRDTGKQYEVKALSNYTVSTSTNEDLLDYLNATSTFRVSKDKFFTDLAEPIQTKTF